MIREIDSQLEAIRQACRRQRVKRLYLFGSAAKGRYEEGSSDLDFAVIFQDLAPVDYADAYFGLLEDLERLLGAPVDLIELNAVQNPYFRQALEDSRVQLYAA